MGERAEDAEGGGEQEGRGREGCYQVGAYEGAEGEDGEGGKWGVWGSCGDG